MVRAHSRDFDDLLALMETVSPIWPAEPKIRQPKIKIQPHRTGSI